MLDPTKKPSHVLVKQAIFYSQMYYNAPASRHFLARIVQTLNQAVNFFFSQSLPYLYFASASEMSSGHFLRLKIAKGIGEYGWPQRDKGQDARENPP